MWGSNVSLQRTSGLAVVQGEEEEEEVMTGRWEVMESAGWRRSQRSLNLP